MELSAAVALGLAVVILSLNWIRGGTPKLLEYADVVYFAGLAVLVAFASPGTRTWLELWGGEVANVAVFAIAFGSVLLRMPFTLQYAREDVPEEYWHEPEFLRVNYLITWVWVVGAGQRSRATARYAAEYPADTEVSGDLVHAWPVVASIAAGRVTDVDTAASGATAWRAAGVVARQRPGAGRRRVADARRAPVRRGALPRRGGCAGGGQFSRRLPGRPQGMLQVTYVERDHRLHARSGTPGGCGHRTR